MSNFKTHGEASQYCEKYGFSVPGNISAFDLADALLRAYQDGAKEPSIHLNAGNQCIYCRPWFEAGHTKCGNCGCEKGL